jgi:hypothetical protein
MMWFENRSGSGEPQVKPDHRQKHKGRQGLPTNYYSWPQG